METPLHMEVMGSGLRDIVVCAGLSQTIVNWKGLARFYPKFRWILFDARGQGQSPLRSTPYWIDDHVADLMEITGRACTDKPTLLGFSHGGHVALRAGARYPGKFSRIIAASCPSRSTPYRALLLRSWTHCLEEGGVAAFSWAALPTLLGPRMLEAFPDPGDLVHAMVRRNNPSGLAAMLRGIANYPSSWEKDCRQIQEKVHIFRGQLDPMMDAEDEANFEHWIGECTIKILPHCGHTSILEDSESLADVLA